MTATQKAEDMSPGLQKVVERARRDPEAQFHSLAHLIDVDALRRAYGRLRKGAAVGVDGITKEQYGRELEDRLRDLHGRLKTGRYRHQPVLRVHIPKAPGKTRQIGISTMEDKIVQGALSRVLGAVYEQDFLPCSFGYRPGRGAHDALRALHRELASGEVEVILEADVEAFFDSIDRTMLRELIQVRVQDGSLLRLIGKCLHAGVLEGEQYSEPEEGTAQGSSLSPMLGNIFLHYVLDSWFEREVRPRLRGRATLIRYADDFVIAFTRREDAERVREVLGKRFERYHLRLSPTKTRLVSFRRPPPDQRGGKGEGTLDFLGFTVLWRRSLKGYWVPALQTRRARLHRAAQAVRDWCRGHRHEPVEVQHEGLVRRLRGHMSYFGVQGNTRCLARLVDVARQAWRKWLNRRSQRSRLTWERFKALLRRYPLPQPRASVRLWAPAP
jgi:group II intron reverse transcriptase/maturase